MTVLSTTLIALAVVISATVAVCFHVIDSSQWLGVVGGFGGGTGVLHVLGVTATGKSSGGGS